LLVFLLLRTEKAIIRLLLDDGLART